MAFALFVLMFQTCSLSVSMQNGGLQKYPPILYIVISVNFCLVSILWLPPMLTWVHTDVFTSKVCPTRHLVAIRVVTNLECLIKKLQKVIWNARGGFRC